ncbi:MAG: hypothetical protein HQM08_08265 [Candidatus Riflebacteria bacterium]|nr:hypothetical protein [Candidatus Riflebacteria bacterium]
MKKISKTRIISLLVVGYFSILACLYAQTSEQIKRNLSCEIQKNEAMLENLGKMDPGLLPKTPPDSFKTFQIGWFNIQGKYMSEIEGIRKFVSDVKSVLLEMNQRGGHFDFSDLLIALYISSPNRRQTAANGYLVIDSFYHSHLGKELVKDLISDGSDLLKHLEARRLFSETHLMVSQIFYLDQTFKKQPGKTPPALVQTGIDALSKVPGVYGQAIKYTLNLMGVEDLTASIFTDYAKQRLLSDPKLRSNIVTLYDRLLSLQQDFKNNNGKNFNHYTLWSLAVEITGNYSEAVELIGVFTTQHRTLGKTILPRVESKEQQLPLIAPLIRSASNFFLVQEVNEFSKTATQYIFSYPIGFSSDDPRYYHFWAEAFIAWKLLEQGYKPEVVTFCTHNLGRAYETYTLPANIRFAIKTDSELSLAVEGWHKDIESHKKGCDFALEIWKQCHKN